MSGNALDDDRRRIKLMLDAIGYGSGRKGRPYRRNGKFFYNPWRNCCYAEKGNADWAWMFNEGLATIARCSDTRYCKYVLTRRGIEWLGKKIGVTIWSFDIN